MITQSKIRSILCLDGDLPPASFFQMNLPLIAADGAANQLMLMNIRPDWVIGDLDSIEPQYLSFLKTTHHWNQNLSDFQKCLLQLESEHLLPALVLGINGGCLDHILQNINLFMGTDCIFYAPPITGFCLRPGRHRIDLCKLNTKISLLGLPQAIVSSSGLQWELKEHSLSFPGTNSCFNRCLKETLDIIIHAGDVLVMMYQEWTLFGSHQ